MSIKHSSCIRMGNFEDDLFVPDVVRGKFNDVFSKCECEGCKKDLVWEDRWREDKMGWDACKNDKSSNDVSKSNCKIVCYECLSEDS